MNGCLVRLVYDHGPVQLGERAVLLALAAHADEWGRSALFVDEIAALAGISPGGARGILRRLVAGGWIATVAPGGTNERGEGVPSIRALCLDPRSPFRQIGGAA